MRGKRRPAHSPACRHAPIKTPFSGGTDRVFGTFAEAIFFANRRAEKRGRQVVRQHTEGLLLSRSNLGSRGGKMPGRCVHGAL